MEEKVIKGKKIGFLMLILLLALYAAAFVGMLVCASTGTEDEPAFPGLFGACVAFLCLGWILILGFKVLKPQ
ncbi:MAG: SPFH domain-containing protein, partial [Clostridia bacterium]|nr:SPFH domain-containing protein [Clostridia bacterium]